MAVGQRLGVGHVEREPQPTRLGDHRVGVDDPATCDVDHDRAVGERAQQLGIHEAVGCGFQREQHDHGVLGGQQRGQLLDRVDRADEVVLARPTGDRRDPGAVGEQPMGQRPADGPVAEHHHVGVGQRPHAGAQLLPAAVAADRLRDPAQHRQQQPVDDRDRDTAEVSSR